MSILPPWGYLNVEDEAEIVKDPSDWMPPAGSSVTWMRWREALIDTIDRNLWPRYRPTNWPGAPAEMLTRADLFLLKTKLYGKLDEHITNTDDPDVKHLDFFLAEDDNDKAFGEDYVHYDASLLPHVSAGFTTSFAEGVRARVNGLSYYLKKVFQRPRAYQVAMIFDPNTRYEYRPAASAATPSLVSGHCLQGCIGGCSVYAQLGGAMTRRSVAILRQFSADIGDRRVFAGVHYPSDSLSSWYVALSLIPRMFDTEVSPGIGRFLWGAIRGSPVHAAMESYAPPAGGDSPYAAMLAEIGRLGAAFDR